MYFDMFFVDCIVYFGVPVLLDDCGGNKQVGRSYKRNNDSGNIFFENLKTLLASDLQYVNAFKTQL